MVYHEIACENSRPSSLPARVEQMLVDQVYAFHQHLNSVNTNIQFTLELENTNVYGLPFLDTITSRRGTAVEVEVCRKPTHTDRFDFHFHHPLCHKRSVVNTLLLRARNIPSTGEGKLEERRRVKAIHRASSRNVKERWQQNQLGLPQMVL